MSTHKQQPPKRTPTALDQELDRVVGELCKMLTSEDLPTRTGAVLRMRQLAVPGVFDLVVGRLIKTMRTGDLARRQRASAALASLGPQAFHIGG